MQDERIIKVTSPFDNDTTRGNLCVKGRFGFEYANDQGPGTGDQGPGNEEPGLGSRGSGPGQER